MGIDDGGENMSVVKYLIPTRGMLGLRSEMLTATRGTGKDWMIYRCIRT